MGTSVESSMPHIPQPMEQTEQYADFMDQTRDAENEAWQQRMEELLTEEQAFREIEEETIEQEIIEQELVEEEVAEEEQQSQQEAEVIQDPTAPGQDIDDFLYGFYGLIDDDEYYSDDGEEEDDFY